MKIVYWITGLLVSLIVIVLVIERLAAERIEVVELHTIDLQGEEVVTRLWIVDDEGFQYLRTGSGGSGWFSRIQDNGEFGLNRGDQTSRYTAVVRPEKSERINQLMQDKYTWGDTFIGSLVGGREGSIPIELHPID